MVLCKITRVISMTSSSKWLLYNRQSAYSLLKLTVVLVSLLQTNNRNCSRTEQISRHSPTITASDADFVQSAQEEESSLDQPAKGIDREPSRFRAFCPGLERVQRDPHDSQQPGTTRQDLESTKEPRECNKFRAIRQNSTANTAKLTSSAGRKDDSKPAGSRSSLETRIPYNSRWVLYSSGFCMIRAVFFHIN